MTALVANALWICCAVLAVSPVPVPRTDDAGISVSGAGEVIGKPNVVELHARVAGAAELSSDARVKFLDAKKRALAAIEKLNMKNLRVEFGGVSITQAGGDGRPDMIFARDELAAAPGIRPSLEFAAAMRLSVVDIGSLSEDALMDLLSKLLDRLQDAGVAVEPNATEAIADAWSGEEASVATFVLDDAKELREQAYAKAFADARANAERLATLAGVKLGSVVAISEDSGWQPENFGVEFPAATSGETFKPRLAARRFGPIPVRVSLQVRFAIAKEESGTARIR